MCDDQTDKDLEQSSLFSRRDFGLLAGGLSLAAASGPAFAAGIKLKEREVSVPTPDGKADGFYVAPARGKHPGVLIWPDIYGLRPAMRDMARRLAGDGYAVLVVNPFYRSITGSVLKPDDPRDAETRARIMPMRALLTPDAVDRDAKALVAFLDSQKGVDRAKGVGAMGYCMGGALVLRTAAAMPDRVRAGASYHGGSLATDKADSPHRLLPQSRASYLIAVADNDDKQDPEDKVRLGAAMQAAGLPAEIEVYAGAMHGWCPPDSKAYHPVQAERAWARTLALFSTALHTKAVV